MVQKKGMVVGGFFLAVSYLFISVSGSAFAQGRGRSYRSSSSESGAGSGSSRSSYRDSISEGFSTNERWGHDYARSWNKGGWEEDIMRKGEPVGVRGHEWDRENGHKRDWGSFSGSKWGNKNSTWSQGGHENSFGAGRRSFSGRSWGGSDDDDND